MKDLDGPKEPPKDRAERMWRNNQLRQKYKDKKMPVVGIVDPADIDYVNREIRVDKNPPPEVATVIETSDPKADSITKFENLFKKELRAILNERKQENLKIVEDYRRYVRQQRRLLMLEKLRRYELKYGPLDNGPEVSSGQLEGNTK